MTPKRPTQRDLLKRVDTVMLNIIAINQGFAILNEGSDVKQIMTSIYLDNRKPSNPKGGPNFGTINRKQQRYIIAGDEETSKGIISKLASHIHKSAHEGDTLVGDRGGVALGSGVVIPNFEDDVEEREEVTYHYHKEEIEQQAEERTAPRKRKKGDDDEGGE